MPCSHHFSGYSFPAGSAGVFLQRMWRLRRNVRSLAEATFNGIRLSADGDSRCSGEQWQMGGSATARTGRYGERPYIQGRIPYFFIFLIRFDLSYSIAFAV